MRAGTGFLVLMMLSTAGHAQSPTRTAFADVVAEAVAKHPEIAAARHRYEAARRAGTLRSHADLLAAVIHGAVKRIRPKVMTVAAMFMALVPIMWSAGAGTGVIKRIADPMIGGIFTSFVLELVVYPAIYDIWRWHFAVKPTVTEKRYPAAPVKAADWS